MGILTDNSSLTKEVDTMNGHDFMDIWTKFVTENSLASEYFNSEVKAPLSAIMRAYQVRTLDKQGEVLDNLLYFLNFLC